MSERGDGVTEVAKMRLSETARVDRERLEALVEDYGSQGAERFLGRALEQLALRLNRAERAWRRGDLVRLCHGARELSDVAERVGFVGLARVAGTVSRLAMGGDPVALAATVSRMLRVGEASLMSSWEVSDLSL